MHIDGLIKFYIVVQIEIESDIIQPYNPDRKYSSVCFAQMSELKELHKYKYTEIRTQTNLIITPSVK